MKFLFITSHLSVGGAEKILAKQCQILKKYGFDVSVICTDILGPTADIIKSLGIPIIDMSFGSRKDKIIPLRNAILSINPKIVYINNSFCPEAIAETKKYKLITQVHGCLKFQHRYPRRLLDAYEFDGIITSHPRTNALLNTKCLSTTILNPIDKNFFTIPFKNNKENIICFCGRISKEKSLLSLARIVKIVKKSINDISVVIIGDGDNDYKNQVIEEFDNIPLTITGFVPNPWEIFANAKISVMLSVTEGFSNVLWESYALGIPFVSTDVGSSYLLRQDTLEFEWDGKIMELSDELDQPIADLIIKLMNTQIDPNSLRRKALTAHEDSYEPQFMKFINDVISL